MFGWCDSLLYEILRHTDIISKILQQRTMSASEGQNVAQLTVTTLQKLRNDDAKEDFSNKLDSTLDSVDVSERALPWRRTSSILAALLTSTEKHQKTCTDRPMRPSTWYSTAYKIASTSQNSRSIKTYKTSSVRRHGRQHGHRRAELSGHVLQGRFCKSPKTLWKSRHTDDNAVTSPDTV